jgi:uncharacterized protein (TIGR00645 family)
MKLKETLPKIIFFSRWLQAPLYIGLILVLAVYVYAFSMGLLHLLAGARSFNDNEIMLIALDLIDMVMIANLLVMVIIAGYEHFVSRLGLREHPDHPEWLGEVNAGTMKVKLALALVGISSIHLLRTFIEPSKLDNYGVMWQVLIHLTLLVSAVAIAYTNKLISTGHTNKVINTQ